MLSGCRYRDEAEAFADGMAEKNFAIYADALLSGADPVFGWVAHTVEATASSLDEAVAQGLAALRAPAFHLSRVHLLPRIQEPLGPPQLPFRGKVTERQKNYAQIDFPCGHCRLYRHLFLRGSVLAIRRESIYVRQPGRLLRLSPHQNSSRPGR